MQTEVVPVLWPYIYKALVGLALTGLGGLLVWPFKKAKKEWASLKDAVSSTQAELVLQRTNCLSTLSSQGVEQIKLLGKVSETLDGLRLDTQAQTGFLQGMSMAPIRRRSKKI